MLDVRGCVENNLNLTSIKSNLTLEYINEEQFSPLELVFDIELGLSHSTSFLIVSLDSILRINSIL